MLSFVFVQFCSDLLNQNHVLFSDFFLDVFFEALLEMVGTGGEYFVFFDAIVFVQF